MVREVAGGKVIPAEVLDRILDRADGVPLFLEELTRAVLASGALGDRGAADEPADSSAVPTTLKDSLMAQLDRLSVVKQVAQIGAVIGRSFSRELLAGVAVIPQDDLQRGLGQLVEAGLLHRTVASGRDAYAFKHALVREAAYESLLRGRRRELHARVAEALEHVFPTSAADEPELLAHHYTEAGLAGPAIGH
jgi:predicted ATPase